jgi:hypothetical protein
VKGLLEPVEVYELVGAGPARTPQPVEQSEVVPRHADHCREGLAHGNVRQ